MKRAFAFLLIPLFLLLCGCSSLSVITEYLPFSQQQTGLIAIEGISENTTEIVSADFNSDELVLYASEYLPEQDEYQYMLYLISAKTAKVKRSNYVPEAQAGNFVRVCFDGDGSILLINEYDGKALSFDKSLNTVGELQDYTVTDWYEEAQKIPFNTGEFSSYKDYAQYYLYDEDGAKINALSFYDDREHLYLTDCDMMTNLDSDGHRVLAQARTNSSAFVTAAVYDFDSNTVINRTATEIRSGCEAYCNVGALGSKDAFLSVGYYAPSDTEEGDGNYSPAYYLWHYTLDETETPFHTDITDEAGLEETNSQIANGIKQEYNINILINEPNEYTDESDDYYLHLGAPPFKVYCLLRQLEAFLPHFPDGFLREMYEDSFTVYIGKKVNSDNIGAYATGYSTTPSVTLATDSFSSSTLSHEFMHIIDSRIFNAFEEDNLSFDEEWEKLNPQDFEYFYDTVNYELEEQYQEYFVSAYSTANPAEDRAEVFMNLFNSGSYDEEPYWITESPYAKEKAVFLCQAIRKAYPAMQDIERAYWEKWINITD